MRNLKALHIRLFFSLVVPFLLTGCLSGLFDDGKTYYNDDSQVEFFPLSETYSLGKNDKKRYNINVQLIGKQRSQPLTVGIVVVDSLTTAKEGVQYTPPVTSVTIPADSSSANVSIKIAGKGLKKGQTVLLVLQLEGTKKVKAAKNLRRYSVTIQGKN